jgi:hypothetical protein
MTFPLIFFSRLATFVVPIQLFTFFFSLCNRLLTAFVFAIFDMPISSRPITTERQAQFQIHPPASRHYRS